MNARQLTITESIARTKLDLRGDAKGFLFGPKDDRDPIKRAHIVIGLYVGRYGRQPGWMTCAPSEAAVIGGEVLGVPVVELNHGTNLYRLGPKEA